MNTQIQTKFASVVSTFHRLNLLDYVANRKYFLFTTIKGIFRRSCEPFKFIKQIEIEYPLFDGFPYRLFILEEDIKILTIWCFCALNFVIYKPSF